MGEMIGNPETESVSLELAEVGKSSSSSFGRLTSSFRRSLGSTSANDVIENEHALQWDELYRLPTVKRLRSSLFDENDESKVDVPGKRVVDVTKLGALERRKFVKKLIKHIEYDNLRLLQNVRNRIDKYVLFFPVFMFLFHQAISIEGQKTTLQTDYILEILGLDICADTIVGDSMRRGISGGEKKRLTIGEMIIGPTKALFMDEISNGLDSSTSYQIVACLQQQAHITDGTILVALLQPGPETFDLFDDIILMAERKIIYHGPRSHVLTFFEDCGFRCPERKGVADFLQEVISRKDQAQYWHQAEQSWSYISVDSFCKKFRESTFGEKIDEELSNPFTKSQSHKNAISFSKYSLSKWALFKACMSREYLLMRRNSIIYIFKSIQLVIGAAFTTTMFLRTQMGFDVIHANSYVGALFFSLMIIALDGFPEAPMTVARLAVFYKQRDLYFYPAWSYAIPATILKVPLSLLGALIWTCLTYYGVGYSPEPGRLVLFDIYFFILRIRN
ncbi:hypothetical protein C3L33_21397, partial [Rhododendron williamsianum]